MWNFKWQSRLRNLFVVLVVLFLAKSLYSYHLASIFHTPEFKIRYTWQILWLKDSPLQTHFAVVVSAFVFCLVGLPSISGLFLLQFFWGMKTAFAVVWVFQVVSAFIVFGRGPRPESQRQNFDPELISSIQASSLTASDLSFLPRLFVGLPHRTLDLMISFAKTAEDSLIQILFYSIIGIGIRLSVEALWLTAFVHLFVGFIPFPEEYAGLLLFTTSLLFASIVWPKIPELVPGKNKLGQLCLLLSGGKKPFQKALN